MTKKQIIILSALFLVLILVVVLGVLKKNNLISFLNKENEKISVEDKTISKEAESLIPEGKTYTEVIPENAEPTKADGGEIKIGGVNGAVEGAKQGFFNIKASKDGYSPQSITVKRGDMATIKLSTEESNSDFFIPMYGAYVSSKKGEINEISFMASSPGTFLFECKDFCPQGDKIKGYFIVLP